MPPQSTPDFAPIRSRQTVQDTVYRALRDALMTGRFDPGQVMTIPALAQSFGVSHMPVREALRRLAAENAVELAVNGSSRVPTISRARLDDLFEARYALEGLATERAVASATPTLIGELEQAVLRHERVTREEGVEVLLQHNQIFHFAVYRASGSEVLPQLIESLWLRFGPYSRRLSQAVAPKIGAADFGNGAQHHRAVLAAFRDRDGAAARTAMVDDIRNTHELLLPMIGP
jgi:DNA-binding GntR family transcriptional regulator